MLTIIVIILIPETMIILIIEIRIVFHDYDDVDDDSGHADDEYDHDYNSDEEDVVDDIDDTHEGIILFLKKTIVCIAEVGLGCMLN